MERKLASVRTIKNKEPIEGADRIELVHVDGWKCVSKKDEFEIGDKCIYFEIDSFLPIEDQFEFLRKSCYKNNSVVGEGFRIKTIRLRGQISQGLVIPIPDEYKELEEDTDLTEELGVKKYELPERFGVTDRKGNFPIEIPKTDENRIQNLKSNRNNWMKEEVEYIITEKCEGSSMTVFLNNDQYGVCSRNMLLNEDGEGIFSRVARELNLKECLINYGHNIAIQGELIGPGVQGNYYDLKKHEFRVFNIFDIDTRLYLRWDDVEKICEDYNLQTVPVLEKRVLVIDGMQEEILKYADGNSMLVNKPREGVVFKTHDNSISFKAINNEYLLNGK
jgi:RNA ligase (TIGR02306 family)